MRRGTELLERIPISKAASGVARFRFKSLLRPKDEVVLRRVSSGSVRSRASAAPARIRVFLLGQELFALDPRLEEFRAPLLGIAATSGDVEIQLDVEQAAGWQGLAVVAGTVEAPEELQKLRPSLIAELNQLDPKMTADFLGQPGKLEGPHSLSLLVRLERIEGFVQDLLAAAAGIRAVARSTQSRIVERRRWRPGMSPHRIRSAHYTTTLLPNGETAIRPDVLTASRTEVSADVEEHRQFVRGVRILRRHACSVQRGVGRALQEAAVDADSVDAVRERSLSAPEKRRQRGLVERLRMARSRASVAVSRCRQILTEESWLRGVGEPRTKLAPTPTFLRVGAYSRAFETLRALFEFDSLADKSAVDRFKTTPELYEVWVFVACARMIAEQLAPEDRGAIEAQLAELRRGDRIQINCGEEGRMLLIFEPVIEGNGPIRKNSDLPYRAALTSSALRPDVWIEWFRPGSPGRAVVLDAKCTARFRRTGGTSSRSVGDELEQMRDYRSRVIEPTTGRQPVRGMFQVHYAAGAPVLCNVRQLMQGQAPVDAFITGAVGANPENPADLQMVVARLLKWLMTP